MKLAGGSLCSVPGCFSVDTKFLFLPCNNDVRLVSVATGETAHLLRGHTAAVSGVCLNPVNSLQLCSVGADNTLRLWDATDGSLLKTVPLPAKPLALWSHDSYLYWSTVTSKPDPNNEGSLKYKSTLLSLNLQPWIHNKPLAKSMPMCSTRGQARWCVGAKIIGAFVRCQLAIFPNQPDVNGSTSAARLTSLYEVTCIAAHPTDAILVSGDREGRVTMWFLDETLKVQAKTEMHWHAHAAYVLRFSNDGNYLLSGGEEAVLVLWQHSTGKKRFLPRLGSPLVGLILDNKDAQYAVMCKDNSVRLVDVQSFNSTRTIQGLKHGPKGAAIVGRAGLAIDPLSHLLVCPGSFGALQYFAVGEDRHVFDAQIVDRNYISRMDDKDLPVVSIDNFAFTRDGSFLITADSRVELEGHRLSCLKFWQREHGASKHTLTTIVDPPHASQVHGLVAGADFAVTAAGPQFKVWVRGQESQWACSMVGSLHGARCARIALSHDDSLLAAAFGNQLTLWLPLEGEMVCSLPHADPLNSAAFVGPRSAHLVTSTTSQITMWDLVSLQPLWSLQLLVYRIIADPYSDRFVVLENTNLVAALKTNPNPGKIPSRSRTAIYFDASSPVPARVHKSPDNILCGVFARCDDGAKESSMLLILTKSLALVSPDQQPPPPPAPATALPLESSGTSSGDVTPLHADGATAAADGDKAAATPKKHKKKSKKEKEASKLSTVSTAAASSALTQEAAAFAAIFAPPVNTQKQQQQQQKGAYGAQPMAVVEDDDTSIFAPSSVLTGAAAVLQGAVHAAPPMDRLLPSMLALLLPPRTKDNEGGNAFSRSSTMAAAGSSFSASSNTGATTSSLSAPLSFALLDDAGMCGLAAWDEGLDWSKLSMASKGKAGK